ncbi:YncE family protein [Nocardia sp. NPDC058640]|uniref:YncE family protein n=1 Tax=Nocardia sp. NPDC058640 TaxID=3346571 RepID=UPI0036607668
MCFVAKGIGGIGLVVAVVVASGCASRTPVAAYTPTSSPVTTITDPAANPNFKNVGVGPYRARGPVNVGEGPRSVVVDPGLQQAYVANSDHTVTILDTRSQSVKDKFEVDEAFVGGPQSIAVDLATHLIYVIDHGPAEKLLVVDPATNTVTARIFTGDENDHRAVAVDSDRHVVYVANDYYGTVTAIDTRTHAVLATIRVGPEAVALAVDPGSHRLWVAHGRNVSVVDPVTFAVVTTVEVGTDPQDIDIDPGTNTAFVTDATGNSNSVFVIDTKTMVVDKISLGQEPSFAVAVDPTTHTAYLTSSAFSSITMIDTRTRTVIASRRASADAIGRHDTMGIAVDTTYHGVYVTHGADAETIDVLVPE